MVTFLKIKKISGHGDPHLQSQHLGVRGRGIAAKSDQPGLHRKTMPQTEEGWRDGSEAKNIDCSFRAPNTHEMVHKRL